MNWMILEKVHMRMKWKCYYMPIMERKSQLKCRCHKDFLKEIAIQCSCSDETLALIEQMTLARELWGIPNKKDKEILFNKLVQLCHIHCTPLFPKGELAILLINETGEISYQFHSTLF